MLLAKTTGIDSFVQFMTVLILFLFVLGITWVVTQYIAKFEKNRIRTSNIELVESFRLSPNKYLQIVKVGNKCFCIAVCKDNITYLGEVDGQELLLPENNENANLKFQEVLEKIKQKTLGNKK